MGAALATLAELPANERIAVLGEMMELGPLSRDFHRQVGRDAARLPLAGIVTVGAVAGEIARGAREGGFDPGRIREAKDVGGARAALEELVAMASDGGPEGRIVLLKASRAAGLERLIG
jgi:UDP-N-acetylmuramoyl-tripeptide--D-alanyl-D-alanine ligase